MNFRDVHNMLKALEASDRTGPEADRLLQRCQRILLRAARQDREPDAEPPDTDPPGRQLPPPPPREEGDFTPPQEPDIQKPRRRDFIYSADTGLVESVSKEAKVCEAGNGRPFQGSYAMAKALKKYTELYPGLLPVMGVKGKMPENHQIIVGQSGWGKADPRGIWFGDHPIDCVFIGMSPDAEIKIGLGGADPSKYGLVDQVGLWDLGIRGVNDTFIIRQQAYVDSFLMDGCWWLQSEGFTGNQKHASGMHFGAEYDFFVWRNHKNKGCLLKEHLWYDKAGPGRRGTWMIGNDLKGGNRTGQQRRPHPVGGHGGSEPLGIYYAARNTCVAGGWDHGSGGETYDGGSRMTNWCNPNADVWYIDNKITDDKYGAQVCSWQPSSAGNFVNEQGRTFNRVLYSGNHFENKRGDRTCMGVNAANEVHFLGGNKFEGNGNWDVLLNSSTAAKWGSPAIGQVFIHTERELEHLKSLKVGSWSATAGSIVSVTDEMLELMFKATEALR